MWEVQDETRRCRVFGSVCFERGSKVAGVRRAGNFVGGEACCAWMCCVRARLVCRMEGLKVGDSEQGPDVGGGQGPRWRSDGPR